MHIVIDGRAITRQLDGIGRYSINVIENVTRISPEHDYSIIVRKGIGPALRSRLEKPVALIEHSGHMSIKGLFLLGKFINRLNPDLYHSLFMLKPLDLKCPAVITVHDLMWLTRPKVQAESRYLRLPAGYLFHYLFVSHAISSCARLIAVSGETAREVSRFRPSSASKIRVIGEGIDPIFWENPEPDRHLAHLNRLGLTDQSYLLHMSNGKPYKNTGVVIEAFARIADITPVRLVIIGRRSAFSGRIDELIKKHRLGDRVSFLGSVKNPDVAVLLKGALALVFPSLYEGFGLPVIEAMASGCPVLTSDRGALKEVAGDSALLVDPTRAASIARGLARIVMEPDLRTTLRERGRRRAPFFNWQDVARHILNVYREFER